MNPSASPKIQPVIYRGAMLHCLSYEESQYVADGALAVDEQGRIAFFGGWGAVQGQLAASQYEIRNLPDGCLLMPGLIDMHVHLPQLEARGCQAENLLQWLAQYIFPAEAQFSDTGHARRVSELFFSELLRHGTTTAAVFLTSHYEASEIAFEQAEKQGNRVIMGLNLMDKNAPAALLRSAHELLKDTEALCKRWHGVDDNRLQYAWMPRFAITSSEELLEGIGALRAKYPDVYFHTHLSEQVPELDAVKKQFPWADHYTHVYDRFGLLAPKSILAHGIYLSDPELDRIDETACGLAHCPSSNFFLKSGKFNWFGMLKRGTRFGLGTDVGAGPSLSMFDVMRDAQYTQAGHLIPLNGLLYAATLGAAKALHLDEEIGNFAPGKQADFVILNIAPDNIDPSADKKDALEKALSGLVYLAEKPAIVATAVRGKILFGKVPAASGERAALAV